MQLQAHVSRPDCISNAIHFHSWDFAGLSNFFTLNVPFSYSTSALFAKRILSLIERYDEQTNKERIHIADIGAGLGLLAYRLLEVAYETKSPVAEKLHITITEFSTDSINRIKQNPIMSRFESQLAYDTFDLFSDSVSKFDDVDIVLMIYVLDISAQHLEYKNGKLYEWLVASSCDDDDYILDCEHFPPTLVQNDTLKQYFNDASQGKRNSSCTKLGALIQEDWKQVPRQISDFPEDCRPYLSAFLDKQNTDIKFNFCAHMTRFVTALCDSIKANDQLGVVFDFGVASYEHAVKENKHYMANYGIGNYFTLHFPLLHHSAEQAGIQYLQSHYASRASEWCVLHSTSIDFTEVWQTFKEPHSKEVLEVLHYLESWKNQDEQAKAKIPELLENLSEDNWKNYNILLWSAKYYIERGEIIRGLELLGKLERLNGNIGLSAYQLRLQALLMQGKAEEACELAEQLMPLANRHVGVLYQRCFALGQVPGKEAAFIQAIKEYLYSSDHFIPWRFFIAAVSAYVSLKQDADAKALLTWFKTIHDELELSYSKEIAALEALINLE